MTELDAVSLSVELWHILVTDFPKTKEDSFLWDDVKDLANYCPMCEINCCDEIIDCTSCILNYCYDHDSDFKKWLRYTSTGDGSESEALQAAKNILKKLEDKEKELKG